MEHVLDALLLEPQTRNELVVAAQGRLELQIHASHHSIDSFFVHLGKRKSALAEKQVTRVLGIVEVVGIVHNAFDVAFVIAHLHTGFKNVFIHVFSLLRYHVITS